jgi:hypothetical protein
MQVRCVESPGSPGCGGPRKGTMPEKQVCGVMTLTGKGKYILKNLFESQSK